jgi:hypothetical protein
MNKIFKIIPLEEDSENFVNILPASEFVPEWYRKSPSVVPNTNTELFLNHPSVTNSTYKKCSPFFDALTIGYMVYLSADIEIIRKPDGMPYIMWRTKRDIITEHTLDQWDGLPCPDGYSPHVYKWHNQFVFQTPKDYSALFVNPINRFDLPFQTITGVVDTDVFDIAVHFPFFIKKDFSGIIEKGTPITQIIPIKRDDWIRNVEKSKISYSARSDKFLSTIKRSYKQNFWHRKEYK